MTVTLLGDLVGASDLRVAGDAWHLTGLVYARQPGSERKAELAFRNAASMRERTPLGKSVATDRGLLILDRERIARFVCAAANVETSATAIAAHTAFNESP